MEEECACDVCDVVFDSHEARTPDGYCAFCSRSCFPISDLDGRPVRSALGRTSRRNLHAMARAASDRSLRESSRDEAAEAAVRILGPWVERGGRSLVDFIRRKIKGSGD